MGVQKRSRSIELFGTHEEKYLAVFNHVGHTWDQLTQEVLGLAGLSIFDRLDSPELKLPKQSTAYQLGNTTLREFITGAMENSGMAMSWDKWVENVMAFRINKEIGAQAADAETLLREYNSVVQRLGRKPTHAQDYVRALNDIKNESVEKAKTKSKARLDALESRVGNLLRDIDYEKGISNEYRTQIDSLTSKMSEMEVSHIESLEEQEARLTAESEARIKALKIESESEKEEIRAESRKKIEALKEAHKSEIDAIRKEYESQIALLKSEHEAHIKSLTEEFNRRIESLESEIVSLKDKYETGNFIEISKYEELKEENARFRNSLEKYQAQLAAVEADLKTYEEKVAEYETEKSKNNEVIGRLQGDIQKYESKLTQALLSKKEAEQAFAKESDALKKDNAVTVQALTEKHRSEVKALKEQYNNELRTIVESKNSSSSEEQEKRIAMQKDFDNKVSAMNAQFEQRIESLQADKESKIDEYQAKMDKMSETYAKIVDKFQAKLDRSSSARVRSLEQDIRTYQDYLSKAKDKYEQLKFKHSILMESQFEMSENMDNLLLEKTRLVRRIKKQNKVITGFETIIRKKKVQAGVAIAVGFAVSMLNWFVI